MPPLEEGAILYMPTTMPGISVAEAKRVLQVSDWVLKQFPEVEYILSKAGRTRYPNRSRAAVDAADRNHPEAEIGAASRRLLVFVMGA